jgi:dolichol-phosphate mannosyltransferase
MPHNLVSIIIPVLEELYIDELKGHIGEVMRGIKTPHEVLVQQEKGLSNAVLSGVKRARGEIIVVMDGDGSHTPQDVPRMIELLEQCDVVVGSKYTDEGKSHDTFLRRFVSVATCYLARLLLDLETRDNMSGFIAARRPLFEEITVVDDMDYKFGLELIARSQGRVREHPIIFRKRVSGSSKASITQGLRALRLIWRLRSALT